MVDSDVSFLRVYDNLREALETASKELSKMCNSSVVDQILFSEPITLERFNKAYAEKTEEEIEQCLESRGAIAIFESDNNGDNAVLIGGVGASK